jgi:hypothetical protein
MKLDQLPDYAIAYIKNTTNLSWLVKLPRLINDTKASNLCNSSIEAIETCFKKNIDLDIIVEVFKDINIDTLMIFKYFNGFNWENLPAKYMISSIITKAFIQQLHIEVTEELTKGFGLKHNKRLTFLGILSNISIGMGDVCSILNIYGYKQDAERIKIYIIEKIINGRSKWLVITTDYNAHFVIGSEDNIKNMKEIEGIEIEKIIDWKLVKDFEDII